MLSDLVETRLRDAGRLLGLLLCNYGYAPE
jgi:hypothetical protein